MKELDLLKKDWQHNNHADLQFSEKEIYAMLHTRSSSVVKWILIVGIIEFIFWLILALFAGDDSAELQKAGLGDYLIYLDAVTYINYVVIVVFIYFFYKNYQSISTVSDTKKLMKSILKVRKTVNCYVTYNLAMVGFLFFATIILTLMNMPELSSIRTNLFDGNHTLRIIVVTGFLILIVCVIVFIFWIFYKILYGILLKKLLVNYQELKKIDL